MLCHKNTSHTDRVFAGSNLSASLKKKSFVSRQHPALPPHLRAHPVRGLRHPPPAAALLAPRPAAGDRGAKRRQQGLRLVLVQRGHERELELQLGHLGPAGRAAAPQGGRGRGRQSGARRKGRERHAHFAAHDCPTGERLSNLCHFNKLFCG